MAELHSPKFQEFLKELEIFSSSLGLDREIRYCRRWEYPWLWLNGLESAQYPLLDIGSALSPFPWFLSTRGSVTMTETDPSFVHRWSEISQNIQCRGIDPPRWSLCSNESLPFPSDSFGSITSVSVIEHQPDKALALDEIVRVLRPGGTFYLTFDLFEPSMGMTYPRNDIPLNLSVFESLIWDNSAFKNSTRPSWNISDVPEFLRWHSSTAPQHTYVAGAAILTKIND